MVFYVILERGVERVQGVVPVLRPDHDPVLLLKSTLLIRPKLLAALSACHTHPGEHPGESRAPGLKE